MISISTYSSILMLLLSHRQVTAKGRCEGYEAEKKPGTALAGHVIKTVNLDEFHCMNACYVMLNCFSINSYRGSNGDHKCEMNKSSRRMNPGSLVSRTGFVYHEITVRRHFFSLQCYSVVQACSFVAHVADAALVFCFLFVFVCLFVCFLLSPLQLFYFFGAL